MECCVIVIARYHVIGHLLDAILEGADILEPREKEEPHPETEIHGYSIHSLSGSNWR